MKQQRFPSKPIRLVDTAVAKLNQAKKVTGPVVQHEDAVPPQSQRIYIWQLGKGSSNYQTILERRREQLREKDMAGSKTLQLEWAHLISELYALVAINAGIKRREGWG